MTTAKPGAYTLTEAASLARATQDTVKDALGTGDLRSLKTRDVHLWIRGRIVALVTPRRGGTA